MKTQTVHESSQRCAQLCTGDMQLTLSYGNNDMKTGATNGLKNDSDEMTTIHFI